MKTNKKRKLKEITFDFKGAHLAYTDASQGGAASGYNEPYLLKSLSMEPTQEQLAILKDIDEELTPLDKTVVINTVVAEGANGSVIAEPSIKESPETFTAGVNNEVITTNNEVIKGNTMSEQDEIIKALKEQVEQLTLAAAIEKAKNSLAKYSFDAEVLDKTVSVFAKLQEEGQAALLKAFDTLVEQTEVVKAQVKSLQEEVEVEKAKKLVDAETIIVKAAQDNTSNEVGHSAAVEVPVTKSAAEVKADKVASAYKKFLEIQNKG